MKRKTDSAILKEIKSTCVQYGVELLCDDSNLNIKFKDGKMLTYCLPRKNGKPSYSVWLEAISNDKIHGRIFDSKTNKFLGYAPNCKTLDEILINVDLMQFNVFKSIN